MKRGDVFWCNLEPAIGSEIKKIRPCVIVSNDLANQFSSVVTIVPITSKKTEKIFPDEVLIENINGLVKGKAVSSQIRTVDKKRVLKKIVTLSPNLVEKLNATLMIHLSLLDE
jgi:mRNA interferase MazF